MATAAKGPPKPLKKENDGRQRLMTMKMMTNANGRREQASQSMVDKDAENEAPPDNCQTSMTALRDRGFLRPPAEELPSPIVTPAPLPVQALSGLTRWSPNVDDGAAGSGPPCAPKRLSIRIHHLRPDHVRKIEIYVCRSQRSRRSTSVIILAGEILRQSALTTMMPESCCCYTRHLPTPLTTTIPGARDGAQGLANHHDVDSATPSPCRVRGPAKYPGRRRQVPFYDQARYSAPREGWSGTCEAAAHPTIPILFDAHNASSADDELALPRSSFLAISRYEPAANTSGMTGLSATTSG
ncbi:hypothetical protein BJ912DRAFT_1056482 [Pholiota molesta]|nr:hypothetical protein BJ912DRAFT_1056482 [Pholiota molesta]